jgi:hypothetical protein
MHILDDILARIRATRQARHTPVVVFDLDHTLFDNGTRTISLLRAYALAASESELHARLLAVRDLGLPYMVKDVLALAGEHRPEIIEAAQKFWLERFFTDEIQRLDVPMAGARAFANEVFEAGATVVYLSGRDVPNMLVGCTESLRTHGFPVGLAHTLIVLKPTWEMRDLDFKRDVIDFLGTLGHVVATFDNEPANCNLFRRMFPKALSVFLDTAMAPDAPPLDDGIPWIKDFRRGA